MGRFSLAEAPPAEVEFELVTLDEERIRDQLSAAEELLYVGHMGPTAVASGAAVMGAMRLSAGHLAGNSASSGALLEALLATRRIDEREHDLLYRGLSACERLAAGYMPDPEHAVDRSEMVAVIDVVTRLLEDSP